MDRKDATARVQVYFENPKIEAALRREARVAKLPLSRAAERVIERGLLKRPAGDPEDRLLALERAFRDHMRNTARDMSILQELLVEVARVFLLRLPDTPADQDPLIQAAVEARIQRLFDAVASRIAAGGSAVVADEPRSEAAADRRAEPRSFQAAE
jgi:hypothetical protein